MLIKVFCVVSMLSKLGGGATGLLNKGGGSNRLPVEFPQVQTSKYNYFKMFSVTCYNHYFVNSLIICPDN